MHDSDRAFPVADTPFIRRFPGDPECIRDAGDIARIERIPADERFPCRSTWDAISIVSARCPQAIAVSYLPNGRADDDPRQWSYADYRAEIVASANLFHHLGLGYEESVAILLPNIPEMLFAIWGSEAAGIAAPINPFLQAEQIANIAREADARILVTLAPEQSRELWEKASAVLKLAPAIRHVVVVGGSAEGALNWVEARARQQSEALDFTRIFTGQETASYFHTGGTTGVPKLARRTHRGEIVNVCQMNLAGLQPEDLGEDRSVILCGLPLFHASAYVAAALGSILREGELLLAGPAGFRNKGLILDFWKLVDRYRVTFFAVVPTVYAALLDQPVEGCDLSSLRLGGSGGSPMPVSLLREFRSRSGADIVEGYGMTESTACATSHTYRGARKPGSVGLRLPYQQVRIVTLSEDGAVERDCGVDEIGVILLSGPNVIPEYKQDFANIRSWPEPGWLNTGDLGRCDADGYYWITGRLKDLIIRGGHNIDPRVTEEAVAGHPDVSAVAAVGMPDAYSGEVPVAYVVLREGAGVVEDELIRYARNHAAERAGAPVRIYFCDTLPLTPVGKVFKPALRKDAIARAYGAIAEACCGEAVAVTVEEDARAGLKVVLRIACPSGRAAALRGCIADRLDALAYPWELAAEG